MKAAVGTAIAPDQLGEMAGWPDDRARAVRVAEGLVADGVLRRDLTGNYLLA